MLHRASRIRGATVRAIDGEIGSVSDFYFHEDTWTIRYVCVDTGKWLSGRRVLLSPMSVAGPWDMAEVPVRVTRDQVLNSPQVDDSHEISREMEAQVLRYYRHPLYWEGVAPGDAPENPGPWGHGQTEPSPATPKQSGTVSLEAQRLRSTKDITGYHLNATDREIGHVDDFLIGEESWRIRYLVVDTSNWIGGKWVVVATDALREIDPEAGVLRVGLASHQIESSPSFESIEAALGPAEAGPPFIII